jgi:hypothetical protein
VSLGTKRIAINQSLQIRRTMFVRRDFTLPEYSPPS